MDVQVTPAPGTDGAVSELADLEHVPLADLPAMGNGELSATLRRIIPDGPSEQVAVAAFNSSI